MQIGAFVFACGYDTYGTEISGAEGGVMERLGERSGRGRKLPQSVSDSQIRRGFTLVDSESGCGISYAKSCICKLTSAGMG